MSPRRFDGWEPREVHEFYDKNGDRCSRARAWFTVVTREPEWDDASRGRAMRLLEHEDGLCGCGCGLHTSVSRDPDRVFVVDEFTCHAGRALEVVRKQKADAARDGEPPMPPGHHLYVRPHDPDRDQLLPVRRTDADEVSPGPPPRRQRRPQQGTARIGRRSEDPRSESRRR